jgi:outer membrane protein W
MESTKEYVMRKTGVFILILSLALGLGFAQERRFQLSIYGGVNHVLEYGSEDDYIMGENDFPVTPSHTPLNFGLSLTVFLTDLIGIEVDGRYFLSTAMVLEDPSDQDTVEIDSSKHYSLTANLIFQIGNGTARPYFVLGGGFDKLLAEDQFYTTEYGWPFESLVPEKTLDMMAQAGAGIMIFFLNRAGLKLDVRYIHIFSDPDDVRSFNGTVGFFIRF